MSKVTLTMHLVKEHKTLAEYAETENGVKVAKSFFTPVYIRKSMIGKLPASITVSVEWED